MKSKQQNKRYAQSTSWIQKVGTCRWRPAPAVWRERPCCRSPDWWPDMLQILQDRICLDGLREDEKRFKIRKRKGSWFTKEYQLISNWTYMQQFAVMLKLQYYSFLSMLLPMYLFSGFSFIVFYLCFYFLLKAFNMSQHFVYSKCLCSTL